VIQYAPLAALVTPMPTRLKLGCRMLARCPALLMKSVSACEAEYAMATFSPSEDQPETLLASDGSWPSWPVAAM